MKFLNTANFMFIFHKIFGRISLYRPPVIIILLVIPILFYLCCLGAGGVYVSGKAPVGFIGDEAGVIWRNIKSLNLPGLHDPGMIYIDKVDWYHAIRNAIFMFSLLVLIGLMPIVFFVAGVIYAIIGLFTGNWSNIFAALLAMVLVPLIIIGAGLVFLLVWILLLFQPCTPAYALIWLIISPPFIAMGFLVIAVIASPLAPVVKSITVIGEHIRIIKD